MSRWRLARSMVARWAAGPLVAGALAGCAAPASAPGPLRLTTSSEGADTRLTLHAAPHLKINARLAPVLELGGGTVLRFTSDRLSADSAYFTEPPSAVLAGRHARVHGTLRASVCEEDERVCRVVSLAL